MKRLIGVLLFLSLLNAGDIRKVLDDVGFCTRPDQIEKVVSISESLEKQLLNWEDRLFSDKEFVAAIAPHDDHLYAGRVYVHSLKRISKAKTVIIFGVTHSRPRKALSDPHGILIFDDFEAWKGPYAPVKISPLRECLLRKLDKKYYIVSRKAHELEHSIEAMIPFLQFYNRDVKILPVMVTRMSFERMKEVAKNFASAFYSCMKESNLNLIKDVSFLISTDTTHYGPDFDYQPYGIDEKAHFKATQKDLHIGRDLLGGRIGPEKIQKFYAEVIDGKVTWCGRYTVAFSLFAVNQLVQKLTGRNLYGYPLRYGDSYSLGVLPLPGIGIGLTAPFSLKHWVGYWAIGYVF